MPFGLGKKKSVGANTAAEDTDTTTIPADLVSNNELSKVPTAPLADKGALGHAVSRASTTHEYPTGLRLALILVSVFVSMFLVALDRLIISTVCLFYTGTWLFEQSIMWRICFYPPRSKC